MCQGRAVEAWICFEPKRTVSGLQVRTSGPNGFQALRLPAILQSWSQR